MSRIKTFREHLKESAGSTYTLQIEPFVNEDDIEYSVSQIIAWSKYQSRNGFNVWITSRIQGRNES